ncbi:MAG: hypothetical protein KatS3mg103_1257 [Phycisphaerales bacterium]|nr:MAG: hypothetical protein KatS3mg103_1257 [Phycisphaerales bacterium]
MQIDPNARFATKAIHAGQSPDPATGAICTPIYQTSTFVQKSPGVIVGQYDYSRAANPHAHGPWEANLASLEGRAATAWPSPAAWPPPARSSTCSRPGDHVLLCDDVYGGTNRLFNRVFRQLGIEVTLVDMTDPDALR